MTEEKRLIKSKSFQVRSDERGAILTGYAIRFNEKTNIGNSYYEIIERGAITAESIEDVALFVNHDSKKLPLARYRASNPNSTMQLMIDNQGLKIRAVLDVENNLDARALYSAVERGDLSGMSFAFRVGDEEWQDLKSDMPTRIIKQFKKIWEVSAVVYPAYGGTSITTREELLQQIELARAKEKLSARQLELNHLEKKIETEIREMTQNDETADKSEILAQRQEEGVILRNCSGSPKEIILPLNVFGELRTISIAGNTIAVPSYSGNTINADYSAVSSVIDAASHLQLQGGESFKQPYSIGNNIGGYTDETANANSADVDFGFADINKAKITVYTELTEEIDKMTNSAYADYVFQHLRNSIRQFVSQEMMYGVGIFNNLHNRITGIFSSNATAIDSTTDLSISTIDDTTLTRIISEYDGGDNVDAPAVLILNKKDLTAFASVHTSIISRFYDIRYNTNGSGTINGVPYIINSACNALSAAGTSSGDYCMAYGSLKNYQLVEFSQMEVKRSDHYRFKAGVVCFKATGFIGGNVVKRNGFLRIKKS